MFFFPFFKLKLTNSFFLLPGGEVLANDGGLYLMTECADTLLNKWQRCAACGALDPKQGLGAVISLRKQRQVTRRI